MTEAKWHITDDGERKRCDASKKACKYAGRGHYDTQADADQAYHDQQGGSFSGTAVSKPHTEEYDDLSTPVYNLPKVALAGALKKIEKANKRAERSGIDERIGYTIEEYIEESTHPVTGMKVYKDRVRLTLDKPVLKHDGWTFAGKMTWDEEAGLITRMAPGQELLERPAAKLCDVCGKERVRTATYIVQKNNEQKQVGSNCLKRFMGITPGGLWMMESDLENSLDEMERDSSGLGRLNWRDERSDSVELMALALAISKDRGWVSRAASNTDQEATVDIMFELLNESKPTNAVILADYRAKAAKLKSEAEAIIKEAQEIDGNSEYAENLRVLASAKTVSNANAPLFLSAIGNSQRNKQREVAKEAQAKSEFIGQPGEKVADHKVTIEEIKYIPSNYGGKSLVVMVDEDGNRIKTFYSGSSDPEVGKSYSLSGTIKTHNEWNGVKETLTTRCKWKEARPDTKPATALPEDSVLAEAWTTDEVDAAFNKEAKRLERQFKKKAGPDGWEWNRPKDPALKKEWDDVNIALNADYRVRWSELTEQDD